MTFIQGRNAMKFVLASIAVNAVIGIIAIVSGDFSDLDGKILVTSMSLTGGLILALASLTARTQRFVKYVPEGGAAFSIVGFALLIYGAWTAFDSDDVGKAAGTAILFAAGITHSGLLSRSRLMPRYRPVLQSAWLFAAVLVTMITMMIWTPFGEDNEIFPRVMGVVIILLAAVTLAVPVLHRSSRMDLALDETRDRLDGNVTRYCPICGSEHIEPVAHSEDVSRCEACGARFTVNFPAQPSC